MWAAIRGHRDALAYLGKNANRKLRDGRGRTLWHLAVLSGKDYMIDVFQESEVETGARDQDGHSPLHLAALHGLEGIFSKLVDNLGASVEVEHKTGKSMLHFASMGGIAAIIQRLLKERQADITSCDLNYGTPLRLAVRQGKTEAIQMLVDHGVDIEAKDSDNRTLLYVACITGNKTVV
ncbi:hypothetical protein ACHAP5_007916 [Fusarium lateritium]